MGLQRVRHDWVTDTFTLQHQDFHYFALYFSLVEKYYFYSYISFCFISGILFFIFNFIYRSSVLLYKLLTYVYDVPKKNVSHCLLINSLVKQVWKYYCHSLEHWKQLRFCQKSKNWIVCQLRIPKNIFLQVLVINCFSADLYTICNWSYSCTSWWF